jgi:hypothetical protein
VTIELPRDGLDAIEQYDSIKTLILRRDIPGWLEAEQKKGFPKKYELLVTQRGKQSRRSLASMSPAFFNIGTDAKPTTFEFVGGATWELVADAVEWAIARFRRTAPYREGKYSRSLMLLIGSRTAAAYNLRNITKAFTEKDRLYIAPTVAYANMLEVGYFTGYYKNARKGLGIMYYLAQEVNAKYGASVACRMIYVGMAGGGTVPALEFGVAGAFPSNSTRPARKSKKMRRGKR